MVMHNGGMGRRFHLKRTTLLVAMGFLLVCLPSGPVSSGQAPVGVTVTKFASVLAESHAHHKSYVFFADRVKELTGGKLIVNVYPNSQLGNEREYVEFLQTGQTEFGRVATSVLGPFVPQFQAFDLPYLFKSKQEISAQPMVNSAPSYSSSWPRS